jgi:TolA-binding protein
MTHSRSLTLGGILVAGALAFAQTPPPPPPATAPAAAPMPAPAPPAAPTAAPTPAAVAAPFAYVGDLDLDQVITPEMQLRLDEARERIRDMRLDLNIDVQDQIEAARAGAEAARASAEAVRESLRAVAPAIASAARARVGYGLGAGQGFAFAPQIAPVPPLPPTPPAAAVRGRIMINMGSDRAYSAGQSALDSRRWEDAVTYFGQVISRGTARVDGALYWKAYAQGKLGRRDDALATIAELRKSYPSSKWLDEAKALEVEINQGVKPLSAEAETDEDIKVLILQQGIQTDFDRFYPALEKIIKGSASPKLKRNALYVLADSSNPKAQTLIEQVARGGGNPDLQVKAIQYMTERRRGNAPNSNVGQILSEIYSSTNDNEVKREVLNGLVRLKDKDRLVAILKTEKNSDLRRIPIGYFGEIQGNVELWQLYPSETTPEGKIMIIDHAHRNGTPDKILEVIRTEKDTKVRVAAVHALGSYGSATDSLVALYGSEQDPQVKQAIIDQIFSQRNGKAMVDLVKTEKDLKMKVRMVERMSGRKDCKECQDYLLEMLNK